MKQGEKNQTVCVKLPESLLQKIDSMLSGKTRSEFIREAILEKLSEKDTSVTQKLGSLEAELSELKKRVVTIEQVVFNKQVTKDIRGILMSVAKDDIDSKIIGLLLEKKYVKVSELEKILPIKRRQIANRLKRLSDTTGVVKYISYEKNGITKAWWLITNES